MKLDKETLNQIYAYQAKNYIVYPRTNERTYKNLRIFYVLAFAYQFIVNIILILGMSFARQPLEANILNNTIIATVLLAAAFIIMFFKYAAVSFLLNVVSVIFEMSLMVPGLIMNAGVVDIEGKFYWQFLIPTLIILITSLAMGIISSKERYIIKRDHKAMLNQEYNTQFEENK